MKTKDRPASSRRLPLGGSTAAGILLAVVVIGAIAVLHSTGGSGSGAGASGPGAPTPNAATQGQTYVVQAGDNPTLIASTFGISADQRDQWIQQLLAINDTSATSLQVGQTLQLPGGPLQAAAALQPPPSPTAAPIVTATPIVIIPTPLATYTQPGPSRGPVYVPYPGNSPSQVLCRDGTTSQSAGRRACSGHGGVKH